MRGLGLSGCVGLMLLASVACDRRDGGGSEGSPGGGPMSSDAVVLEAMATAYGECAGPCVTTLTISDGALHLDIVGYDDDTYASNDGLLTDLGQSLLEVMEAELADAGPLQETYGCPDCDDGGLQWARLANADGNVVTHTWEAGDVPEPFLQPALLFRDAVQALSSCEAHDLVIVHASCEPADL